MKVLVVSNLYPPDFLGGYELGCRQMADALRAAGHEVAVLTAAPRAPVPPQPGVLRRLKLTDVYDPYCQARASWQIHALRYTEAHGVHAFNVAQAADVLRQFDPDVVYLWNLVGLGGVGLIAATQMLGYPWVMHLMDAVPKVLCQLPFAVRPEVGAAFARAFPGRYLCCSRTLLNEIEAGGVPIGPQTALVPNWVDTHGSPGRTAYRRGGLLRVAFAGAVSASKGVDVLIRAAGLLRDRGRTGFEVDIYGRLQDQEFPALVRELDLADRVRLCGPRTQAELAALYPGYDVFAFPTWAREPMAFAPLEAMAHGCAAVVSRVSGNCEWLLNGTDCIKADRTPAAFADALEGLLSGRLDVAAVGTRGRRAVLEYFRLDAVRPRVEAELALAARRKRPPTGTPEDAYRAAVLAEKMTQTLIHETIRAA